MSKLKNMVAAASLVAGLALSSTAMAATVVDRCDSGPSCTINFDGTAGTFGNANVVNTPFVDRYFFDLGTGLLSFTLSTTYAGAPGGPQDIDFDLVRINAPGAGGFTTIPLTPTTDEFYQMRNLAVDAGQYVLRLQGSGATNLDGSYSGTLNFTPGAVPEPAAWLMMLVGFGAIGAFMRKSNARFDKKIKAAYASI